MTAALRSAPGIPEGFYLLVPSLRVRHTRPITVLVLAPAPTARQAGPSSRLIPGPSLSPALLQPSDETRARRWNA